MDNIAQCAHCNRDINLNTDAQTRCPSCNKDFCFSLTSTCFTEYHHKNKLFGGHADLSISNPSWKINLRVQKE